jgi:hypothetical protein
VSITAAEQDIILNLDLFDVETPAGLIVCHEAPRTAFYILRPYRRPTGHGLFFFIVVSFPLDLKARIEWSCDFGLDPGVNQKGSDAKQGKDDDEQNCGSCSIHCSLLTVPGAARTRLLHSTWPVFEWQLRRFFVPLDQAHKSTNDVVIRGMGRATSETHPTGLSCLTFC